MIGQPSAFVGRWWSARIQLKEERNNPTIGEDETGSPVAIKSNRRKTPDQIEVLISLKYFHQ
jgi:hypothetical protein